MGSTKEGEKVDIRPTTNTTRYGQLLQGVTDSGHTKFLKVNDDGKLETDISVDNLDVNIGDVGLIDEVGNPINSSNPLPVTGGLAVSNALDFTSYDLNATIFSETSNISNDFVLDNIEFNFSTTESKTITITTGDGTVIWEDTNTNQSVYLSNMNIAFNGAENFTVGITQFSSAGTCDVIARVRQGSATPLVGNPVLGAGNEHIGSVDIDNMPTDLTEVNVHTSNKEIRVFQENHICIDNTTETPLGVGEVFLGEWQDVINFAEVRVSVIADQDSAVDGLEIQWSHDGVTAIQGVEDNFTVLANKGKTFSSPKNWPYFRLKYTNGSVAQTQFHLYALIDRVSSKGSMHRIKDEIVADDDGVLNKSVLTGESDDGTFNNVHTDLGNNLRVNSFPYTYSISEGDILGHSPLLKFGTRTTIAAATPSLIWEGPTALYTYMTTAQQLKVSSSSASDSAAGTGVRTLTLIGLDANFDEIEETITMTGLTVVTTINSFIRIFRAYGATCGTSYTNVGTITVRNNASTITQLVINPGDGQTLMTNWTVPAGKVFYMTGGSFSSNSNKGARVSFFVRKINGGIQYPWQIKYRAYTFQGNENFNFEIPFRITSKTDIEVRVNTPGNAGDTSGGATFEGWYEDI